MTEAKIRWTGWDFVQPAKCHTVSSRIITNIRVNYRRGIEKVTDYLHSLGHRRLGFVGHHATLGPINERMKAVLDAVARNSSLEVKTAADADTLEGGRQATRALLSSGYQPTAIICVNDVMAVGALRELRERGIRVPHDMSVTGFDNVKLSEFCYPALTTLHIPRERIGHIICDCLIPRPGKPAPSEHEIVIDPEFVVRESTGPAPAVRKRWNPRYTAFYNRTMSLEEERSSTVGFPF